jgi:prolyl-tRNA editing enzyme YbaK/EbsC (Cys-tRNA(Pro) deacylase)
MFSASAVLTSPSVERVRLALERAGVATEIVELPGAARTAKAAAAFLDCDVAQIANSLVFRAEERNTAILVISSGAKRVDAERLAQHLGERVGKADADFVRAHTGFAIGGVAPVGHGVRRITDGEEATLAE